MGWEKRGNSEYYYTKERIDGKVKSVYVGGGEIAGLASYMDSLRQDEEWEKSYQMKMERAEFEEIDELLNEITEINKSLVDALFLFNGYHQHKRQWRKKRK